MSLTQSLKWTRWAGRIKAVAWLVFTASAVATTVVLFTEDSFELYFLVPTAVLLGLAYVIASILERLADRSATRRSSLTVPRRMRLSAGFAALLVVVLGFFLGRASGDRFGDDPPVT